MKILLLIHGQQARGQEIFAAQLGQEFLSRGMRVLLVCLYTGNFRLPFSGKMLSLDLHSSRSVWNPSKWKDFARIVADFDPDLIQANGGDTLKFLALASFFFSKKAKLVFNNGGVMGYYLKHPLQKSLNAFFLKRMDGLVSVSAFGQSDLEQNFDPKLPHSLIPIAVQVPKKKEELRGELTWVHIGGFTVEKNHEGLLRAFQEAVKFGVQGNLFLVGEGPLRPTMERLTIDLELDHRVTFMGNLEDPWAKLSGKLVLLLPSRIEGMPGVLAEALCLGVPAIAYRVGGVSELENRFSSLICIPSEDSKGLIRAMVEVQDNWEAQLDRSKLDQEKAKQFFSLSRVAKEFLDFYQKL